MELESDSAKSPIATTKPENSSESESNITSNAKCQALFRGYLERKYFYFTIPKEANISELFLSPSELKQNLSSIISQTLFNMLEKHGMYFSLEQLSEISWNTQKFKNSIYFGEIDGKGFPNGKGIFISFKTIYEGYWNSGCRQGKGREIDYLGNMHIGNYAPYIKDEEGGFIFSQRNKFILTGTRCGFGIFDSEDLHYEGDFKNGFFNGHGKFIKKNVYVYEGNILYNLFNGNGHLILENGEYFGNFQKGSFNGKGTFKSNEGWLYEGEFHDQKKHGFFTISHPLHGIIQCFYFNDKMTGEFVHHRPNRDYLERGFYENNCKINHMDKITPNIFLGDEIAGNDAFWLNQVGIKAIVRVLFDGQINTLPGIVYLDFTINDTAPENIVKSICKVVNFMNDYVPKDFKILFYSFSGMLRASALLIGYFIMAEKMKGQEAFNKVTTKRKYATITKDYVNKLIEIERGNFTNNSN